MARLATGIGLFTTVVALTLGAVAPAAAEFFGCNDKPGRVLASYTGSPGHKSSSRHTHEFAAQSTRPRITVYPRQIRPGRTAKRQCRSWLAKEYRVSGPVIVPRMQCWWQ